MLPSNTTEETTEREEHRYVSTRTLTIKARNSATATSTTNLGPRARAFHRFVFMGVRQSQFTKTRIFAAAPHSSLPTSPIWDSGLWRATPLGATILIPCGSAA